MLYKLITGLHAALVATSLFTAALTTSAHAEENSMFKSEDQAFAIFLLLKAERAWLDLAVPERFAYLEVEIQPILDAHAGVDMKFWDTEHFNARISDVLLFETQSLGQYQSVVEKLRETLFWDHYFQVVDILPGIENAYATYYEQAPVGQRDQPR